jgi:hypothetical protein
MRRPWPALGRSGTKKNLVNCINCDAPYAVFPIVMSPAPCEMPIISALYFQTPWKYVFYDDIIFTLCKIIPIRIIFTLYKIIPVRTTPLRMVVLETLSCVKYSRSVWATRNVHYIPLIFPALSYNIQFTPSHPVSVRSILVLSIHACKRRFCVWSVSTFPTDFCINWSYFLCLPQVLPISSLTWSPE